MSKKVDVLMDALGKFDQEEKPISERDVSEAVKSVKDQNLSAQPMPWVAEASAFDFCEDYQNQTTGWGTYYGPMFVLDNGDGTATESPSLKRVTEQIINYWTERAKTAKHPVLRARYADLVWDFQEVVTKTPPHYSMAQIAIDSIIEIAQNNCYTPVVNVKKKLERALSLAIALNFKSRIKKVADATIAYEDTITDDARLGLWGFAYDLLFENTKVKLAAGQKQKMIDDLEGHLLRASHPANKEEIYPWAVEAAALRLARYYRKVGRNDDVRRVIVAMGDAFIQASSKASALQTSAWFQRVHSTYNEFGLTDEAEEISIKLREVGEKTRSELQTFSHTMEVPKEKMDKYIADIIEGEPGDVLLKIAAHYIPKKGEVEEQLKDLASQAPIAFLIPLELQDNKGRPIAKVGSFEEDIEGHTVKQMSQNMAIESIFLRKVLESLVQKYPNFEDIIVEYIFNSPVFEEDRKSIIRDGIKEYLNGNHVTAVHLLIPQIENALRVLLEISGGSVLKPARGGGFYYKLLDDLLREPLIVQVFREDIVFYFRSLLVDQRGWNLRHSVCHGHVGDSGFTSSMSDRIIHVLLCLALVRKKEQADIAEKNGSETNEGKL
ncbi:DUF4209 domain-containing protein [Chloroflexota bacterium]